MDSEAFIFSVTLTWQNNAWNDKDDQSSRYINKPSALHTVFSDLLVAPTIA